MAEKKLKPFVFNDETIKNSYDFRVRNAGIDCTRFDGNSVMLNSHENTTAMTLGNWQNRRIEGSKMLGDSNFDLDMESAKEVAGQVDRGFIKGCSMGLGICFDDDSWVKAPDGVWELTKCELMEVSICAVPSNSGALALYNSATGELIAEDQFKLSLQNLSATEFKNPNTPKMEKIILSTAALSVLVGLNVNSENPTTSEISGALVKLNADLSAEKTKSTELQAKLDKQAKLQAEVLVDGAIADEKLTAGDREDYLELALANYSLAAKQIGKLKGKASLSASNTTTAAQGEVKTKEDFYKLSTAKQLAFKEESPEAYKALFAK